MQFTSKIVYKRSDYANLEAMFDAMKEQIGQLLKNNYMCSSYRSVADNKLYVVEFSSSDVMLGGLYPIWLTTEEIMSVYSSRKQRSAEEDEQADIWLMGQKAVKNA